MLKKQPVFLLIFAAAAFSGACKMTSATGSRQSSISGAYYHKPWKGYTTFYIHPDALKSVSLTPLNQARICAAVANQMIAKGLTRGDATADLVVNIVSVDSSMDGQRKGRPSNEWFRVFHGVGMNVSITSLDSLKGTLIPDSLLGEDHPRRGAADSGRGGRGAADGGGAHKILTDSVLGTAKVTGGGDSAKPAAGKSADTTVVPKGPPTPRYVYGALIIEVIDKKRRMLIWEGVADRPVDVPMKDPDRRIGTIITRMMTGFSPDPGY